MIVKQVVEGNIEYTVETDPHGTEEWLLNGQYHREHGPARTYYSPEEEDDETPYRGWYRYDQLHRLDGPAIIFANGHQVWYYQGQFVDVNSQSQYEKWLKLNIFT